MEISCSALCHVKLGFEYQKHADYPQIDHAHVNPSKHLCMYVCVSYPDRDALLRLIARNCQLQDSFSLNLFDL